MDQPLWLAGGGMTNARFAVIEKFRSQRAALDMLLSRYKNVSDPESEFDLQEVRLNAGELLKKRIEENFGDKPMDSAWSRSWIVSFGYDGDGYIHRWVRDDGEILFTIREVK